MAGIQAAATVIGMVPVAVATGIAVKATRGIGGRGRQRGRTPRLKDPLVVSVATTRPEAEKYATRYRKALKRKNVPYVGRVKVKRVSGGYAVIYS